MVEISDLNHILEHTDHLWDELKNTRIFITGGTGFFGCWLLESLLYANKKLGLNCKAVVLTRDAKSFQQKTPHLANDAAITFCVGDVRNFVFPEGEFTHIIHASLENATNRIIDFARHCHAKKILFTSSGAVYDHGSREYREGKILAEKLLCDAAGAGFEVKIARCFAFVGPYLPLDVHFAIGNFILAGLRNEPIIIKGDGTPYRSYLYAADLMIWLWTILFKGISCRPYDVGSEDAISISELANKVANHFEPKLKIEILKKPNPNQPVERYVPSTARARNELGLKQFIDLDDAIEKTKKWNMKND